MHMFNIFLFIVVTDKFDDHASTIFIQVISKSVEQDQFENRALIHIPRKLPPGCLSLINEHLWGLAIKSVNPSSPHCSLFYKGFIKASIKSLDVIQIFSYVSLI